MSLRAREFVDFYIQEFLHPDTYEDEETYDESTENAEECIHLARMNGRRREQLPARSRRSTRSMATWSISRASMSPQGR